MPGERRRHQLYEEVKRVLSEESADELMSYLPPVGWADVATKADLNLIRSEMDALRAELRGEIAELRGEIAELRGEMGELRGEGRSGISSLRVEIAQLRADFQHDLRSSQRWTISAMGVMSAILFGALQIAG